MKGQQMAAEMAAQPEILGRLVERRPAIIDAVTSVLPDRLNGVLLIARGSSDHAAIFGRYVLELASQRPVALAAPSLQTLYGAATDCSGYLAVAVSQSGETPEIVKVLDAARASGARSIAITNRGGSLLAKSAEAVVELGAGEERAVPATKTFTAQLAAFAFIAEAIGTVPWSPDDWNLVPSAVAGVIEDRAPARSVAQEIGGAEELISVGRGFDYERMPPLEQLFDAAGDRSDDIS